MKDSRSEGEITLIACCAEHTGRARAAAIAPIVKMIAVAVIAGMRIAADDLDQRVAAEATGKRPRVGLVDPHQRRMDDEARVHPEIERELHCLHGVVAAVRIAGEIRLAHAGDDALETAAISERARKRQKHEIAAGHEGVRQPVLLHDDLGIACECGVAHLAEHGKIDHVVFAEPRGELRQALAHRREHFWTHIEFDTVALTIVEA